MPLLAIGFRCTAKNMLKVTHKCQLSNRGTANSVFVGFALGATMLTKPRWFAQMFHIAPSPDSSGSLSFAKSASPDVPGAGTQR